MCLSFKCGVGTVVMKNCDPFVPGPARKSEATSSLSTWIEPLPHFSPVPKHRLTGIGHGQDVRLREPLLRGYLVLELASPAGLSACPIAYRTGSARRMDNLIQSRYSTYQMDHQFGASASISLRTLLLQTPRIACCRRLTNLRMTRWKMRLL